MPQWSPVVTTGTTRERSRGRALDGELPQWSPVVTTGTTLRAWLVGAPFGRAAMEPRRDDGDDPARPARARRLPRRPQWSPVVTTGTTGWRPSITQSASARRNGAPS